MLNFIGAQEIFPESYRVTNSPNNISKLFMGNKEDFRNRKPTDTVD